MRESRKMWEEIETERHTRERQRQRNTEREIESERERRRDRQAVREAGLIESTKAEGVNSSHLKRHLECGRSIYYTFWRRWQHGWRESFDFQISRK